MNRKYEGGDILIDFETIEIDTAATSNEEWKAIVPKKRNMLTTLKFIAGTKKRMKSKWLCNMAS